VALVGSELVGIDGLEEHTMRHFRRWLLLILVLFWLPPLCLAQRLPDSEADGFAGRVRRVKYEQSIVSDQAGTAEAEATVRVPMTEIAYDTSGKRTESTHYMTDGSRETEIIDGAGRSSGVDFYGTSGGLSGRLVFSYDNNGRLSVESRYSGNGELQFKKVYSYSDDGKRVEKVSYNNGGTDRDRTERTLRDVSDNVIEEATYNLSGTLATKTVYEYDGSVLSGATIIRGADGYILSKVTYRRDSVSRVVGADSYGVGGKLESTSIITYDTAGNRSNAATYKPDGTLKEFQSWRYDEKGNEAEYKRLDAQGTMLESLNHSYEYDSHGNWTKDSQRRIEGGIGTQKAILRAISYY